MEWVQVWHNMKNLIQCPICGKNGIPDFHKEDVVCPCCGSDLSVYHNLSDLSELGTDNSRSVRKSKYLLPLVVGLISVIVVGCILIQKGSMSTTAENEQIVELRKQNTLLNDSILSLNKKIAVYHSSFQQQTNTKTFEKTRIYVVKRGDSFCKISKQLYGTEVRYIEIVKLNNLNANTVLHKGDSLKVPVK